jgi:hypothetical protein
VLARWRIYAFCIMRGLLATIVYTNTSRYIPCYMSQANVTPELVMEQETISAAMEMAKPRVCVIRAGGAGSKTLSRGLRARAS